MSLCSTEMGDHLGIIIFSSILLILLNSLRKLRKTPTVYVVCDVNSHKEIWEFQISYFGFQRGRIKVTCCTNVPYSRQLIAVCKDSYMNDQGSFGPSEQFRGILRTNANGKRRNSVKTDFFAVFL